MIGEIEFMNTSKKAVILSLVLFSGAGSAAAFSPVSPSSRAVNPNDYPKLTETELGHIRHLVKMAHQLPGDWSGYGSQWLLTERTQQFQLAFSGMTLALVQHQYTPAYRELYREAIDANIQKLQRWFVTSVDGAACSIMPGTGSSWRRLTTE